jgi:hypothetical protein
MDAERWFRLREDYVHLACSERFMRQLAERRWEAKATPAADVTDTGE